MTTTWEKNQKRLLGLLADRALFGLTPAENRQLRELLPADRSGEYDEMEQIAAVCCLALGIDVNVPHPADLQDRIRAKAHSTLRRDTIQGDDELCQKT